MSTIPPINLRYLSQISDGDRDFELELLNLFIGDAKLHLDAAEAGMQTQDYKAVEREAHHLKGSSGNVGAQSMQSLAYDLEQESLKHSLEGVPEKIRDLRAYLLEIETFVNAQY